MRVLIACEFSGIVRDAFISKGHDAWSCDLLPSDAGGNHLQGDVLNILEHSSNWDLIIAHPPCTYLCNSGVRWLRSEVGRWDKMEKAVEFFNTLLRLDILRLAVENPVPHGHAMHLIDRWYNQIIKPSNFGHREKKKSCFWLKGLPKLVSTNEIEGRESYNHRVSPGFFRWKIRSRTLPGIADAMADQWGSLVA
jgi:hypothetical protein